MALKSNIFRKILFVVLLWAYPGLLPAVTPPVPAQPSQYVVDLAGVLDAGAQARLNAMLKDLETKTTAQVVVLTINSLDGEPIENFSHQTAVKWGIGKKGKDNGVLVTVAVKDHKYRIEVGYGLEGPLPDSLVGSIGRQYLVPHFRKGDFAGGIVAAVTEVINKIAAGRSGEVTSNEPGETATKKDTGSPTGSWLFSSVSVILFICFIILLLVVIFSSSKRTSRRGDRDRSWFFGGSGGGWSSGGGDSGGFSGGGGDFGGGGASGDW